MRTKRKNTQTSFYFLLLVCCPCFPVGYSTEASLLGHRAQRRSAEPKESKEKQGKMSIREIFFHVLLCLKRRREGNVEQKERGKIQPYSLGSPSPSLWLYIATVQSRPFFEPLSLLHAILTRCPSCTLFLRGSALSHCHKFHCLFPPEELSHDSLKSYLTFKRACLRRHPFLRLQEIYQLS